jgi:hypothetical protein
MDEHDYEEHNEVPPFNRVLHRVTQIGLVCLGVGILFFFTSLTLVAVILVGSGICALVVARTIVIYQDIFYKQLTLRRYIALLVQRMGYGGVRNLRRQAEVRADEAGVKHNMLPPDRVGKVRRNRQINEVLDYVEELERDEVRIHEMRERQKDRRAQLPAEDDE